MIRSLTLDLLVRPFLCIVLMVGLSLNQFARAATITVNVVDDTGAPVNGFRYLVEEDHTYVPRLGQKDVNFEGLSFNFHKSHQPVAINDGQGISGETSGASVDIQIPDTPAGSEPLRYFVSVAPYNNHALGGGAVEIADNDTVVNREIRVNRFPIPTSQISVWVFEDNNPVNGALDIDEQLIGYSVVDGERRPFSVKLFDAAGQYGMAGGHLVTDAYGNPVGTEYGVDADGNRIVLSTPADTNGFILVPGDGTNGTESGKLTIKHLPAAKYGVEVVPPTPADNGDSPLWVQTSTIEGSKTIDAWVKANEPATFVEFGPPGPHVFVGFVRTFDCFNGIADPLGRVNPDDSACRGVDPTPAGTPSVTLSGQIANNHMARSPNFGFFPGESFDGCRVAVNLNITGRTVYSQPCGDLADYEISNVPVGTYSLSIWDDGLNVVIANHPFTIQQDANGDIGLYNLNPADAEAMNPDNPNFDPNAPGPAGTPNVACADNTCDMGRLPVFDWFHHLDTVVFHDENQNGVQDGNEGTLHADSSATNIRFRDGRVYKSVPIDVEGAAPHEEIFPFFHWLVAEVDYANFKATGATMIADEGGGDVNPGDDLQANGYIGSPRTETGEVLTQAFQGFLGQKNTINFGKADYAEGIFETTDGIVYGENGGISGMVFYAITRAEDDPRYAAAEEWEPGIPRVQVALFQDKNSDGIADDLDGVNGFELPDVDNYPLDNFPGAEDTDRNGNGIFDQGDAQEVTWTDSWDDNLPTGCQGSNSILGLPDDRCFDGLRNWNQVRPGVFDGGFAFSVNLVPGQYIVQTFTPPGYTLLKEEDKNVDFGDEYAVPTLLPPICVGGKSLETDSAGNQVVRYRNSDGSLRTVSDLLSYVTDANGAQVVEGAPADYAAPYAGENRPLCDAKQIRVADGRNAAADFFYFTEVPKAAHVVGGVINDFANEFDPNAPNFGEKFAPPWLPVAFYDYQGHEIHRVYTDQHGKFNAILPSTNTVNIASASGMAPNMVTACMNDAGLIDTDGDSIPDTVDPRHNPQYSQFCYVFQYMPGATTYLDTPVQQIAAFAGSGLQLDCELADATPMIESVISDSHNGPFVNKRGRLTITAVGNRDDIPNPMAAELDANNLISRNYGFGTAPGSISLIRYRTSNGTNDGQILRVHEIPVVLWTDSTIITDEIRFDTLGRNIAAGQRYQLVVTSAAGVASPIGITVTVGNANGINEFNVIGVQPSDAPGATPIQDAIDAAAPGDLILVEAGVYNEIPIMHKPVFLQGAGAFSTTINARSVPNDKVEEWHAKMDQLIGNFQLDLLPGQETGPGLFTTEAGAGLTVVGNREEFQNEDRKLSGADGFKITGGSTGGGMFLNGYIRHFVASNNLITGNQGTYGGGIRLGHFNLVTEVEGQGDNVLEQIYPDAQNEKVKIRHNMITRNGTFFGAGGGISLYTGSTQYRVHDNFICGNFAATDGAGIGHLGVSDGGQIEDNTIIFNQSFRQTPGFDTDGGGIFVGGLAGLNAVPLTPGAGDVLINRNLIQGNQAGAGDGGGIALRHVNGLEMVRIRENGTLRLRRNQNRWNEVQVFNNTIANNMAGGAGGGISLNDAARVDIRNNTVVNNESTGSAGSSFEPGSPGQSTAQVAGIASRAYSDILSSLPMPTQHPDPTLEHNIVWHNRSRYYVLDGSKLLDRGEPSTAAPSDANPSYWDLGVIGVNGAVLDPVANLLTSLKHDPQNPNSGDYSPSNLDGGNLTGGDLFVGSYRNGSPYSISDPIVQTEFKTVAVRPALDEGGNWLDVRFAPLSINTTFEVTTDGSGQPQLTPLGPSDYHLLLSTVAEDAGLTNSRPEIFDIDGDGVVNTVDLGSDEVVQ